MWVHKNTFAIGGLENVGFVPAKEFLIVLSSQGQGIFDCKTGEKIARQNDNGEWWDKFNEESNSIIGFDFLDNVEIRTHGFYGEDNLPKINEEGWELMLTDPEPDEKPFEKYLVQKIYLVSPNKKKKIFISKDGPCELRAYGFSDSGKTFIVALSCELVIFREEKKDSEQGFWSCINEFYLMSALRKLVKSK